MSIKLIASDLDGTLVDHNNFIPVSNLDAIESINAKDINFAICTGKTYSITKDICQKCHASYGIFGNGTQIINLKTGEEIYKSLVSVDTFNICYKIAKEDNLHVHIYTDSEVITEKLMYMDLRNYMLQKQKDSEFLKFKIEENLLQYVDEIKPQIFKLVISGQNDLSSIKNKIQDTLDVHVNHIKKTNKYKDMIINKEYEYLDITPKDIGKGYALDFLSKFLNVNNEDVMAIGDNINDIDMIENSGVGVTLSSAYDEVKKIAKYTTTNSVENGGFAEAVYKFIS